MANVTPGYRDKIRNPNADFNEVAERKIIAYFEFLIGINVLSKSVDLNQWIVTNYPVAWWIGTDNQ